MMKGEWRLNANGQQESENERPETVSGGATAPLKPKPGLSGPPVTMVPNLVNLGSVDFGVTSAGSCQAPFACNQGPNNTKTIGPTQQWHPAKSSWLDRYATQVGCELGADADQAEGIVGSAVATIVYASQRRWVVSAAFFTAYTAQLLIIREK